MGPLGMGEIVVLFILALLIFGPKKLPELGKTFGKGMAEFKRASNELKTTFQREMDNIEHETKDVKGLAQDVSKDINTSYYDDYEDDYYNGYDYDSDTKASTSSESDNATAGKAESEPASDPELRSESDDGSASSGEPASPPSAEGASKELRETDGESVSGLPEAEAATASKSS